MIIANIALTLLAIVQVQPGTSRPESLMVGGKQRDYILHVPKNYKPNMPLPLVIAFHGMGETAQTMESDSDLSTKADGADFIVVYPDGIGNRWDVEGTKSADIPFVDALIVEVSKKVDVDRARIFAVGMSNGGMMANRLAVERSTQIAAVASVTGPLVDVGIAPTRPVPTMHFHGTDDKIVNISNVAAHKAFWFKHNRPTTTPTTTQLAPAPYAVTQDLYSASGAGSKDVVIITIKGGGHLWPGRPVPTHIEPLLLPKLGQTNMNLSANDEIWKFFLSHPLP